MAYSALQPPSLPQAAPPMIGYQLSVLNRAMSDDRPALEHAARLLAEDFGARHGWLPGPVVADVEITEFPDVPAGTRFLVVVDP